MKILELRNENEFALGTRIAFDKGTILRHEGEPCLGAYFVNEGLIRILSYSKNGTEIVYNEIGSGGIFGNNLAFASQNQFRGNVTGAEKGSLNYFEKEILLSLFRTNEAFQKEFFRLQADFVKELNAKIKILSFPLAEERLEFLLSSSGGTLTYPSITALSARLYLTREATSRLLHQKAREGKIVLAKGKIFAKDSQR